MTTQLNQIPVDDGWELVKAEAPVDDGCWGELALVKVVCCNVEPSGLLRIVLVCRVVWADDDIEIGLDENAEVLIFEEIGVSELDIIVLVCVVVGTDDDVAVVVVSEEIEVSELLLTVVEYWEVGLCWMLVIVNEPKTLSNDWVLSDPGRL